MARPSARRRIIMPLLILIVGGGIAIWGAQHETERHRQIRQLVLGVCETALRSGDVTALLPTDSPAVATQLNAAIVEVCAGNELQSIDVAVRSGDTDGYRGATHVAVISVLGVERLGLRFEAAGDDMVVLGYVWLVGG